MRSQVLSKQDKSFSQLNSVQEEKKGPGSAETFQENFLFPILGLVTKRKLKVTQQKCHSSICAKIDTFGLFR